MGEISGLPVGAAGSWVACPVLSWGQIPSRGTQKGLVWLLGAGLGPEVRVPGRVSESGGTGWAPVLGAGWRWGLTLGAGGDTPLLSWALLITSSPHFWEWDSALCS